jgi:hypothetical protein
MIPTRSLTFHSALSMIGGLKKLFADGLRPSEVTFIAFDRVGDLQIEIPSRFQDVNRLKVGHKFTLSWPFKGRVFYVDALHALHADVVVLNGDRRIGNLASLVDVATMMSWFISKSRRQSIFFGCTPHQPGSWWIDGEHADPLHVRGFVELVPTPQGLLARRTMDPGLYFLPQDAVAAGRLDRWQRIFTSPLGNVLMLERRMLYDQLVLSCQQGLVEVDLYDLPRVSESGRFTISGGYAVVGRISGGSFAVTRGTPRDWGFDDLRPAILVGSAGCSFMELRQELRQTPDEEWEVPVLVDDED